MKFLSVDKQLELIKRGAEEIIPEEELRGKLERSIKTNKPIIAAFSLKIRVQRAAPITIHEAPVSLRY